MIDEPGGDSTSSLDLVGLEQRVPTPILGSDTPSGAKKNIPEEDEDASATESTGPAPLEIILQPTQNPKRPEPKSLEAGWAAPPDVRSSARTISGPHQIAVVEAARAALTSPAPASNCGYTRPALLARPDTMQSETSPQGPGLFLLSSGQVLTPDQSSPSLPAVPEELPATTAHPTQSQSDSLVATRPTHQTEQVIEAVVHELKSGRDAVMDALDRPLRLMGDAEPVGPVGRTARTADEDRLLTPLVEYIPVVASYSDIYKSLGAIEKGDDGVKSIPSTLVDMLVMQKLVNSITLEQYERYSNMCAGLIDLESQIADATDEIEDLETLHKEYKKAFADPIHTALTRSSYLQREKELLNIANRLKKNLEGALERKQDDMNNMVRTYASLEFLSPEVRDKIKDSPGEGKTAFTQFYNCNNAAVRILRAGKNAMSLLVEYGLADNQDKFDSTLYSFLEQVNEVAYLSRNISVPKTAAPFLSAVANRVNQDYKSLGYMGIRSLFSGFAFESELSVLFSLLYDRHFEDTSVYRQEQSGSSSGAKSHSGRSKSNNTNLSRTSPIAEGVRMALQKIVENNPAYKESIEPAVERYYSNVQKYNAAYMC